MNILPGERSGSNAKNSLELSLEEILSAALEVCEDSTIHNTPKKQRTHSKRKPSVSAPVAVPRRNALHDQLSSHSRDATADCTESPTSKYNYDLATWRMYNRITTARARRSAMSPAQYQVGGACPHPSLYNQVPSMTVGMSAPPAAPHDTGADYHGDVFSFDI